MCLLRRNNISSFFCFVLFCFVFVQTKTSTHNHNIDKTHSQHKEKKTWKKLGKNLEKFENVTTRGKDKSLGGAHTDERTGQNNGTLGRNGPRRANFEDR
jgi:hypothetical protein